MGGCVEYGFIRLAWNADELLARAHACWCVGGWFNEACSYRPVCRGWGALAADAPTLRHLGYHRCRQEEEVNTTTHRPNPDGVSRTRG